MNIATEPKLAGKPSDQQGRPRPPRKVLWFVIVGTLLGFVGGLFHLVGEDDEGGVLPLAQDNREAEQDCRSGAVCERSAPPWRNRRPQSGQAVKTNSVALTGRRHGSHMMTC